MFVPHSDSQRVLVAHPCASNFPQGLDFIQRTCEKKDLDFCFYAWLSRCFVHRIQLETEYFLQRVGLLGKGIDQPLSRKMYKYFL